MDVSDQLPRCAHGLDEVCDSKGGGHTAADLHGRMGARTQWCMGAWVEGMRGCMGAWIGVWEHHAEEGLQSAGWQESVCLLQRR